MKKILETHAPFIKYSPCYAAAFSIINVDEDNLAWVINNFSYFFIFDNKKTKAIVGDITGLSLHTNGGLSCHTYRGITADSISRDFFGKYFSDFVSFCKDMIMDETYVFTFVNTKYINAYDCDVDNVHPLFISGFDDELEVFYVSDFFDITYCTISISYEVLEKAYKKAKKEFFLHEDYLNGITLYKKDINVPATCTFERTENAIVESIRWLIKPVNFKGLVVSEVDSIYTGIEAQNLFCDYLQKAIYENPEQFFHKQIGLIVEHKWVMNLGVNYLGKYNRISEEYVKKYETLCKQFERLSMKYLYIMEKYSNNLKLRTRKALDVVMGLKELTFIEEEIYAKMLKSYEKMNE